MEQKIEKSIAIIRKSENLALSLQPDLGIFLAFSGGKDSACVLELAKMAGVKFKAFYSVTGIDSPMNIKYIRQYFPDVEFIHPKKNYLQLVEKKGLPMIQTRFCCERLKERIGAGTVMLDGVRAEESRKRAKYVEVMVRSRRKENIEKGRNRTIEEIEAASHRCIRGRDRVDVHPILEWTEEDVWQFLKDRKIPINPCYQKTGRVGCMYCPFASKRQLEMYEEEYPLYFKRLMLALERFWEKKQIKGIKDADDYYKWWKSRITIEKYSR